MISSRQYPVILSLALGAALASCAPPPTAPVSGARIFASDMTGGAKNCTASKPTLTDAKETSVTMQVGNDGGWCAITVQRGGNTFDAGLLTDHPAHGTVFIHPVGDATRIDYTPARGFNGADWFTVRLLPGNPVIRVTVTVTP